MTVDFQNHQDLYEQLLKLEEKYRVGKAGVLRMAFHKFLESEGMPVAPEVKPEQQEPRAKKAIAPQAKHAGQHGLGPDDNDITEL